MAYNKETNHKMGLVDLLFIVIAFLCITYIVMFGHSYGFFLSSLTTVSYIILLFIVAGFQSVYLHVPGERWWHTILNGIIILAFFLPVILGTFTMQFLYRENQFSKYGKTTFGKVIGFESEYKKSSTKHFATLEYNFDDETYNQKIEDDNNLYNVNDSVTILISTEAPELFKLISSRK